MSKKRVMPKLGTNHFDHVIQSLGVRNNEEPTSSQATTNSIHLPAVARAKRVNSRKTDAAPPTTGTTSNRTSAMIGQHV